MYYIYIGRIRKSFFLVLHPNTVFLWNILAYSERSYTRYMLVRRRNRSRKATTVANTKLDG